MATYANTGGDWYTQYTYGNYGNGIAIDTSMMQQAQGQLFSIFTTGTTSFGPYNGQDNSSTLKTIKGAIHDIKDEVVTEESRKVVEDKADKYARAGFTKQADILKQEIKARIKLARIKEWDYKVLPYKAIMAYHNKTVGQWTYYVHIDPVDKYCGFVEGAEIDSEKIVPEHVIDSMLTAKDRQVFDEYHVLWVEKVKDPLLLGKIKELPDFFLIDEWGEDVTFNDIIKASKQTKQKKE